MTDTPAYIPRIGSLLQGLDYDMAVAERVTHTNDVTRHSIEDPSRSFISDHNREEPTSLNLALIVSTTPLGYEGASTGATRITKFQDALLAMRAAQSVATSAYFDVYTGLRVYYNMGITDITFTRDPETPNLLNVDMTLVEFRFARPPRSEKDTYLMDANDGPRNSANAELVSSEDRMLTEATRESYAPRYGALPTSSLSSVRAGIRDLSQAKIDELGIDTVNGGSTLDELSAMFVESYPSQRYGINLDGNNFDIQFDYNLMADRWSFSAWAAGDACPRIAGKFIDPGVNLYADISDTQVLLAVDRPGIPVSDLDWHARMSAQLTDGYAATIMVTGSHAALNGIFTPRTVLAC